MPAGEADIPRILEIERETISPPWSHGSFLSEIYREDSFFAVARGDLLVADTGCGIGGGGVQQADAVNVLGFVVLRRSVDDAELLQLAVDRVARRNGIAAGLLGAALRYAEEHGLRSVFLEVRKSNEAAIALYKTHGFMSVRLRRDYFSCPTEDAVVMVMARL